ncbi:MAG: PDZ domain-containing protein [Gemmatimonadota bacterium]|nr:PDZ domain-containing protein [Gemmatimonadota bacterium]
MPRSIPALVAAALIGAAAPLPAQETMRDTIRYRLGWDNPASQLYTVETTAYVEDGPIVFSLPAWRPGRYIIQNYAANVQRVRARDGQGRPLAVEWADLDSWRVEPDGADEVTLAYEYYANEFDAGGSLLRPGLAYFNPINLLPWVEGRQSAPARLTLEVPEDWPIATQLERTDDHGVFVAPDYHALVDAPTIASPENVRWEFTHGDVPYYVVLRPKPDLGAYDRETILEDIEAIAAELTAMFSGAPYEEYWLLYQFVPRRFSHAVEHASSASFVRWNESFSSREQYLALLGTTAHEIFHAWNVKRLRPAAMWPYSYDDPQLTRLHWFTEGVTSYYHFLSVVRAGVMTEAEYFDMIQRAIQALQNSPGRKVTPVSLASWTSWHTGYGAGNPNQSVSFYTKGALIGLLLDLEIRDATDGAASLDDVMRSLYAEYYERGRGMPEDAVREAAEEIAGRSLDAFFEAYVHGVDELPYDEALEVVGLDARQVAEPDEPSATMGVALRESGGGAVIVNVLPESPALLAGIMRDDVLVSIAGEEVEGTDLDPILSGFEPGDRVSVVLLRGGERIEREVTLEAGGNFRWAVEPVEEPTPRQIRIREAWLAPSGERTP